MIQLSFQVVRAAPPPPRPSISTLTTETADLRTIVDTQEIETAQRVAVAPRLPPPVVEEIVEQIEAPVVAERRPEITSHVVDDVFLRTITEKRTIEDIERHRRQVRGFSVAKIQNGTQNEL